MSITMDAGCLYITNCPYALVSGDILDDSYIVVRIDHQKFEKIFSKTLIEFDIPVSNAKIETKAPSNSIIDLKRFKGVLSCTGVLCSELNDSSMNKEKNLYLLAGLGGYANYDLVSGSAINGGNVTCVLGLSAQSTQQKFNANIQQVGVTETPGRYDDGTATDDKSRVKRDVQLKLAVGTERRSQA